MNEECVCCNCFNRIEKCVCEKNTDKIQIDLNIQYAIRLLNKKGYKTAFCCESHFGKTYNIYIMFENKCDFPITPNGFTYNKKNNILEHIIKRKNRKKEKSFEEEKNIYLKILNEWVEKL